MTYSLLQYSNEAFVTKQSAKESCTIYQEIFIMFHSRAIAPENPSEKKYSTNKR